MVRVIGIADPGFWSGRQRVLRGVYRGVSVRHVRVICTAREG